MIGVGWGSQFCLGVFLVIVALRRVVMKLLGSLRVPAFDWSSTVRVLVVLFFFFFKDPATPEISPLPLHDALPILRGAGQGRVGIAVEAIGSAAAASEAVASLALGPGERELCDQLLAGSAEPRAVWQARFWTAKEDRKSTRLNSSHGYISYSVFCFQ